MMIKIFDDDDDDEDYDNNLDDYDNDDDLHLQWVPPHQLGVRLKIPHEGTLS